MSALAGVLIARHRPIDERMLEQLGRSNAEYCADGLARRYEANGVALLQWPTVFDGLSARERQPYILPDGSVVTFDGRLDGRDDLLLQLHDRLNGNDTDVALVAHAYLHWGIAAFERLIGDWSLAIWNPGEDALILARDYAGNRPLYLYHRDEIFAWSTCLRAVVDTFDLHREIDDGFVAQILTAGPPSHRTAFRHVTRVPSGSFVRIADRASATRTRYWTPRSNCVRYRDNRDYDAHFRESLTRAVRDRLRSQLPVCAELSGGVDSSSVACIGQRLIASGQVEAPSLMLVTYLWGSPESAEDSYVAAVEQATGLRSTRLHIEAEQTLDTFNVGFRPVNPDTARHRLREHMRDAGASVLLTGDLGDLVTGKNSRHAVALLEYLHRLSLVQFTQETVKWSVRSGLPLYQILGQLLAAYRSVGTESRRLHRLKTDSMMRANGISNHDLAAIYSLNPAFVRHVSQTYVPDLDAGIGDVPISKRVLARGVLWWTSSDLLTSPDGLADVAITCAFADRRLVEFVLAIPESVLWSARKTRPLIRRSLQGIVPSYVLDRQNKGYAPPAISRRLRPLVLQMLGESRPWQLVEHGYMDAAGLRRALSGFLDGSLTNSAHIAQVLAVEAWLRHRTAALISTLTWNACHRQHSSS